MKIESKLVHSGDRKKPGDYIPVTTPIYTAASYFYESMEQLDRVFGREEKGPSYSRYDNPTTQRAGRTGQRSSKAATEPSPALPA